MVVLPGQGAIWTVAAQRGPFPGITSRTSTTTKDQGAACHGGQVCTPEHAGEVTAGAGTQMAGSGY